MQKKRLWIALSVLAAIVLALVIIPAFIDWGKYQSLAQTKLKAATGYDLKINGSLRMAILPSPHATVTDVIVNKPVQGHEDVFLTFKSANVRVAFLPLLVGRVEIADVTLDKPNVNLVTYKNGTDNYTPIKADIQAPATDPVTGKPVAAKATTAQGQSIAINGLRIKDGVVNLRNDASGTAHTIAINDLHVKADTLQGPFDGDGDISYGKADFKVSLSAGGYKQGETLPVQLTASDKDDRFDLKYSGIVDTGAKKEVQGEMNLAFTDLSGLLQDMGVAVHVPSIGDKISLSGMLTANADHLSLTNGALALGKTKFNTKLEADGLSGPAKTVTAAFDTGDALDVDALIKTANKVAAQEKKEEKKADKKSTSKAAADQAVANAPLVPANFTLPKDLKADVQLSARSLKYNDQETGAFGLRLTAADGKGDARATVADLPGGGNISLSAATGDAGIINGTAIASIDSLKKTAGDWLKLADAKTFDQPAMPHRADLDSDFRISGNTAVLNIKTLSIGEPKIDGSVAYTVGSSPLVNARLHATVWTLPEPEGAAKTADADDAKDDKKAAALPAKIDIDFTPPQLPFALKFDVALDRLVRGDFVMTDVHLAGDYDGKNALILTAGNATMEGGTLSAVGTVANLKDISGVDVQAGLRTADLESFVQAMTGKPLALEQKIGDFSGSLKAKGDRKSMAVTAQAQAQGYTIDASGTLSDPFSPELPGTMLVRVRHPDMVAAIRAFSPGFGNVSGPSNKPVDISGTAKISGKVYEIADMKGVLGASDIAGSVKADLSGDVPSITADLTSKTLDVGALVGVKSKAIKTASTAAGPASTQVITANAGPAGQWSREPLDTGFLKAINLDIKLNAGTLQYGTWTLTQAKAGVNMKNGTLKVSPLAGQLYGGTLDGSLEASSPGDDQPLNAAFKADVKNVMVGPFLQALTSSGAKRADGTGSVSIDIKGTGTSSAQLVGSLSGNVKTNAKNLVIYGMDIDKLAANIVEAFDGGWKGVIAGFTMQGFSGGQTKFKDFDETFPIANGNMPVKAFKLETTNANAIVNTNGNVSFADWNMNLQSDVQVTQPKDVPVISVRLSGPLDNPQKSVNSQALDNLIRTKLGNKVQDLLGDKINNSPAGAIINNLLGGPTSGGSSTTVPATPQSAAPQSAAPAQTVGPAASQPSAAPAPAQPAEKKKTPQEQLLEGVLNQLSH